MIVRDQRIDELRHQIGETGPVAFLGAGRGGGQAHNGEKRCKADGSCTRASTASDHFVVSLSDRLAAAVDLVAAGFSFWQPTVSLPWSNDRIETGAAPKRIDRPGAFLHEARSLPLRAVVPSSRKRSRPDEHAGKRSVGRNSRARSARAGAAAVGSGVAAARERIMS
jgi:hypothetical protein